VCSATIELFARAEPRVVFWISQNHLALGGFNFNATQDSPDALPARLALRRAASAAGHLGRFFPTLEQAPVPCGGALPFPDHRLGYALRKPAA
jgi:hypothetical protein